MNCAICSTSILENTWIDLAECCNAQVHISCLEELDTTCPSCKKDLERVVLNIIDPNDVGDILDANANEEDDLDVTMQIFHVNEEAEPVYLQFEHNNSKFDYNSKSDESSSEENSSSDSSSSSSEDESDDNPKDPDWDSSQSQF